MSLSLSLSHTHTFSLSICIPISDLTTVTLCAQTQEVGRSRPHASICLSCLDAKCVCAKTIQLTVGDDKGVLSSDVAAFIVNVCVYTCVCVCV